MTRPVNKFGTMRQFLIRSRAGGESEAIELGQQPLEKSKKKNSQHTIYISTV